MAHYAIVDDFRTGMPQTALTGGLKPRGIACHTTEGAEGLTGALGTIQFLIDNPQRSASYHEIWFAEGDGFGAYRIVRPDRAAHSMSPHQPPWAPNARVRRILGDKWADPNAWAYAVSIAGTTARTVPALIANPGFMEGARRRTKELVASFASSLSPDPLFNHGEGQADRSDWGPLMRPALLEEDTLPALKPVRQQWTTGKGPGVAANALPATPPKGEFWIDGPNQGTAKVFTAAEKVTSIAESVDNDWRLIEYGAEVLWMHRNNLRPVDGTRNPVTGYGPPILTGGGFTQDDLTAAKASTAAKANAQMTAWTAARPKILP